MCLVICVPQQTDQTWYYHISYITTIVHRQSLYLVEHNILRFHLEFTPKIQFFSSYIACFVTETYNVPILLTK